MTSNTLSTSISIGTAIILSPGGTYASPFTVTSTGAVYSTGEASLFSTGPASISNFGTIFGTQDGIALVSAGVVSNDGLIGSGAGQVVYNGNTFLNAAIGFFGGGTLTNLAQGTISSPQVAVQGNGTAAADMVTVDNSGLIEATSSAVIVFDGFSFTAEGVELSAGGDVINNAGGSIIGNEIGVFIQSSSGGGATLNNSGLIQAVGTPSMLNGTEVYPTGADFNQGGIITNAASGQIEGVTGVYLGQGTSGLATTLSNFGSIGGSIIGAVIKTGSLSNAGQINGRYTGVVGLNAELDNEAGGTITAKNSGVYILDGNLTNSGSIITTGTTFPDGTITGDATGVVLSSGSTLDNTAGALISGYIGFYGKGTAKLINAGTIDSTGTAIAGIEGTAAYFGTAATPDVVLDPGASFSGVVYAAADNGTLELQSGAVAGSIANVGAFGTGEFFIGFNNITVDAGADWDFTGNTDIHPGDTLTDFGTLTVNSGFIDGLAQLDGGVLDMTGTADGGGTIVIGDGSDAIFHGSVSSMQTIVFEGSGGTLTLDDPSQFNAVVIGSGTTYVSCFCPGTAIATPQGETRVEELAIGDQVTTQYGAQKVKWIGRRHYEGRFIAGNPLALPVTIHAGALATGIPSRALTLSPGHGLFLDGVLVPAWRLVNGVSITQAQRVTHVDYLHVELDEHDLIFAESCAVESYLDEQGRTQFHNAAEFSLLYPDAAPSLPLLPRCEDGFALAALRARIAARAGCSLPEGAGPVRGFVDVAGPDLCAGWAQFCDAPEAPVALDILSGGRRVGRVLANGFRADLRAAGLGSGCHAFSMALSEHCAALEIRVAATGALLAFTEAAKAA